MKKCISIIFIMSFFIIFNYATDAIAADKKRLVEVGVDQNNTQYAIDITSIKKHQTYLSCVYVMRPTTVKGMSVIQDFCRDSTVVAMLVEMAYSYDKKYEQVLALHAFDDNANLVKTGTFDFEKSEYTKIEKDTISEAICAVAFKYKK